MPTLHVRGSDGVVAIFTGADDVLDDPLLDLSRVLFHSALEYPSVVAVYTPTVTLPVRNSNTYQDSSHTLFAHGVSGIPWVFGYITNLGNTPTLAGSVPVQHDTIGGFARWVNLGADATNVILHEQACVRNGSSFASIGLDITVYVTDLIL